MRSHFSGLALMFTMACILCDQVILWNVDITQLMFQFLHMISPSCYPLMNVLNSLQFKELKEYSFISYYRIKEIVLVEY